MSHLPTTQKPVKKPTGDCPIAAAMEFSFLIDVTANNQVPIVFPLSSTVGPEQAEPIIAIVPAEPEPPVVSVTEATVITGTEHVSLVTLYNQMLGPRDREKRVRPATIRGHITSLRRFETWAASHEKYKDVRGVGLMETPGILSDFAEYLRAQKKGSSASMCMKAIASVIKLAGVCVAQDIIRKKPASPSRSEINVLKPRSEKQRRIKAVPVTLDELRAMLAVVEKATWPRLGDVSPATFWRTSLLAHFVYGFRSRDWFGCGDPDKPGLLWSGVINDSTCPMIEDLDNASGWVWYLVNKTKNKDEAAERASDVLAPLSKTMRALIEQFRGIDPVRVFPLRNNSASYSAQFRKIREWAGLSDASREAASKPIIRLSLGRRNVASCRKSCSALWAKYVNRSASSYMLHHSIPEDRVAKMTTDSYLQNEEVLRDITAVIETLPVWEL